LTTALDVGVPEIKPDGLSVNPGGSDPEPSVNVYGGDPPVAVNWTE
jgi:hypothetical protein